MKPFKRADRVSEQIQRALAELLVRQISDPRLAQAVISGVVMSPDLKLAKIYFSVAGGEAAREEALDGFASARGFLKRELAGRLGLRYMPDLRFYYDESFDYGARIDQLLAKLKPSDGSDQSPLDQ